MNKSRIIIFALIAMALCAASCHNNRDINRLLDSADSFLYAGAADSAMALLDSVETQLPSFSRSTHMRFRLLQADAMNKTYRDFTTDSIMLEVARYYDRYGTPNERLRARYLLGCAYRDMGETPMAILTWEDAVADINTLKTIYDYNRICVILSQLAEAYHSTLLFSEEIASLHVSIRFSLLGRDTLYAIDNLRRIGSCYSLLHQYDSAEYYFLKAQEQYQRHGFVQDGLLSSTALIHLYLEENRFNEAKPLMDMYESLFQEFDQNHELPPRRRQYYCYKGYYYEQLGQLDSAEAYYRKAVRPNMDYTSRDPIYSGLLRVFQRYGKADFIAKYAQLYCEVNDSSIAVSDRELTAQTAANYNFTRSQKEAIAQKLRANRLITVLTIVGAAFILVLFMSINIIKRNRKRKKLQDIEIARLRLDLKTTQSEYDSQVQARKQLKSMYEASMEFLRQDVNRLNQIAATYEESFNQLSADIERKKRKIETL